MRSYICVILLVGLLALMAYTLQGCSKDDGSSYLYQCHTTSDSTKVCGDTEYQIY